MLYKRRDVIAAVLFILLCRVLLFPETNDSVTNNPNLTAELNLVLYSQVYHPKNPDNPNNNQTNDKSRAEMNARKQQRIAKPCPVDIDGDGLSDAMIIPYPIPTSNTNNNSNTTPVDEPPMWTFRLFDIRPIHSLLKRQYQYHVHDLDNNLPVYPQILFTASRPIRSPSPNVPISFNHTFPIHITTKHILLRRGHVPSSIHDNNQPSWDHVIRTTYNSIPIIVSLWSDASLLIQGVISSIHTKKDETKENTHTSTNTTIKSQSLLNLDTIWLKHNILAQAEYHQSFIKKNLSYYLEQENINMSSFHYQWDYVDILVENTNRRSRSRSSSSNRSQSSFSSLNSTKNDVIVIVVAQYYKRHHHDPEVNDEERHYTMIVMDLLTSDILWTYHYVKNMNHPMNMDRRNLYHHQHQQYHFNTTQYNNSYFYNKTSTLSSAAARRRSILSHLTQQMARDKDEEDTLWSMHCPHEYEVWLHSLPRSFWNRLDTMSTISRHQPNYYIDPNTYNSIPADTIRSINGNIGSSSLYLSFFQKKYQSYNNNIFIQPQKYKKRNKLQQKIQHQQQRRNYRQQYRDNPIDDQILQSNIIIYVTPQQDIYLHSLKNGSPVCIINYDRIFKNNKPSTQIENENEKGFKERGGSKLISINTSLLLPVSSSFQQKIIGSSIQSNRIFRTHQALLVHTYLFVDSVGMTLSFPLSDYTTRISFPQSIIELPSLFDINGDGLIDLILVKSYDGYWMYTISIHKAYGMFHSSSTMAWIYIGIVCLVIVSAALYNRRQNEIIAGRWRHSRSIQWLGLRSSEKIE